MTIEYNPNKRYRLHINGQVLYVIPRIYSKQRSIFVSINIKISNIK